MFTATAKKQRVTKSPRAVSLPRSLSILLPVKNVQATLAVAVQQLLEVAADLTGRVQVFIFDEGSTDSTLDEAQQLAVRFPQVRLVRERRWQTWHQAVRLDRAEINGDVVLAHRGVRAGRTPDPVEMLRLWKQTGSDPSASTGPRQPLEADPSWTVVAARSAPAKHLRCDLHDRPVAHSPRARSLQRDQAPDRGLPAPDRFPARKPAAGRPS